MSLPTHTVLQPVTTFPDTAVPCRLDGQLVPVCSFPHCIGCKRVRRFVNECSTGERTLGEVAERLHLTPEQSKYQYERALAEGWLVAVGTSSLTPHADAAAPAENDDLAQIRESLVRALGEERTSALLQKAGGMVQGSSASEWLIALELCSSGLERRTIDQLTRSSALA